jgi:hypothetical protein
MKLYHFTDLWFLNNGGTILTQGLKPAMGKQAVEQPPYGVVWLTSQADCRVATREPECWHQAVHPEQRQAACPLGNLVEHAVLAAVKATDREHGIGWQAWFCYFGIISPSMFRGMFLTREGQRVCQEQEHTP